jgi:hypothetical protein
MLTSPMNGWGIYELYHRDAEAAAERNKPQSVQTVPQPGSTEWFALQEKSS